MMEEFLTVSQAARLSGTSQYFWHTRVRKNPEWKVDGVWRIPQSFYTAVMKAKNNQVWTKGDNISVYLPPGLLEEIQTKIDAQGISRNKFIREAIKRAL